MNEEQKEAFAKLVRGSKEVNPYELNHIKRFHEVGLDKPTYDSLIMSFEENVHHSVTNPIPLLAIDDLEAREAFKDLYKQREYFKTLEWPH